MREKHLFLAFLVKSYLKLVKCYFPQTVPPTLPTQCFFFIMGLALGAVPMPFSLDSAQYVVLRSTNQFSRPMLNFQDIPNTARMK